MSFSGCSHLEARLSAKVFGEVQGVFFRAATVEEAVKLGVSGRVANADDGTVEVEAEGERDALESLLAWLHVGPPAARVEKVEFSWGACAGDFRGFHAEKTFGGRGPSP
ncbi:Acylphosphatase [uncultured archaeon]|nr:Acylphosphatase [uncultured archaeon]